MQQEAHLESGLLAWGDIRVAQGRAIQSEQTDRGQIVKSLHVDMLQSSSVETHHRPFYLVLSLLFGVTAFWMHKIVPSAYDYFGAALFLIFIVAYFATRRTTLVLSAGPSRIMAAVKGGKAGIPAALQFAAHVDALALRARMQQRDAGRSWISATPASGVAPRA